MSDLAILAGGDEYEFAVAQIRDHVKRSRAKLVEQFPFFYKEHHQPCTDSAPA